MLLYSLLLMGLLAGYACKEKKPPIDFDVEYIRSAEVIAPEALNVKVDNFAHFIAIDFAKGSDLSNVRIKITPAVGTTLEEPKEEESTYDLTKEASCKLRKGGQSVVFRIKPHFLVVPFDPSPKGWEKQTAFGELPAYLSVYKYTRTVNDKKVRAYMAVANLNDAKARFTVLGEAKGTKTPSQFFESSDKPKVVLNAGYFWAGNALGLMVRDGKTIKQAQTMAWRPYNGNNTVYYPTQGAFGLTADGRFEAHWAYHSGGKLYVYPAPAPNKAGEQPQPIPTDKFPEGARQWEPKTAIGAGPVLIKDGAYKNLWEAELLDNAGGIGPTINNPRSAIAYHPNGYLLFFVCEGRNKTPDTPGLNLKEVADLFLDLGCSQAINLDGGGSSCMLVNGKETILPSDGKQRAVTSMVALY